MGQASVKSYPGFTKTFQEASIFSKKGFYTLVGNACLDGAKANRFN